MLNQSCIPGINHILAIVYNPFVCFCIWFAPCSFLWFLFGLSLVSTLASLESFFIFLLKNRVAREILKHVRSFAQNPVGNALLGGKWKPLQCFLTLVWMVPIPLSAMALLPHPLWVQQPCPTCSSLNKSASCHSECLHLLPSDIYMANSFLFMSLMLPSSWGLPQTIS